MIFNPVQTNNDMIILLFMHQSLFAYCLIVHVITEIIMKGTFELSNQKFQCKHGKTWESRATSYSVNSQLVGWLAFHGPSTHFR